jgi:transcription elongation factor GreB
VRKRFVYAIESQFQQAIRMRFFLKHFQKNNGFTLTIPEKNIKENVLLIRNFMSRGFVREEDQEETPLVPPRAHLPFGIINYVTANGFEELMAEQNDLREDQKTLIAQSQDANRVQINFISSKLNLLIERIVSAKLIYATSQNKHKVLFGATVTLFEEKGNDKYHYQIVGVDEANVSLYKVSFLSPIAIILMNKKVGESITLKIPNGERTMKILRIEYICC